MQYRDVEYQVVQTSNPYGWKWTVQIGTNGNKTGSGFTRNNAIGLAQRAIDEALKAIQRSGGQPSGTL
jgi:hypothetical protein